ncbi:hypothetical protein [Candidatus Allofournierella merdavium]|uniref:hypothetical protein n=1 Tax=Candidatus Allofournierella merdavium TaxID=2838593 RepID=UPI00374FA9EE
MHTGIFWEAPAALEKFARKTPPRKQQAKKKKPPAGQSPGRMTGRKAAIEGIAEIEKKPAIHRDRRLFLL